MNAKCSIDQLCGRWCNRPLIIPWVLVRTLILELKVTFYHSTKSLKFIKTTLDKRCNFSHCKIEIVIFCSESYSLELSLLALKAAISS